MNFKTGLLLAIVGLSASLAAAEEKLAFVFELVRHGARASTLSTPGVF